MKTYLVTGGCGFIGSNFIHYMFNKYKNIKIVNLDCLTYAADVQNLKDYKDSKNYTFVKGNICDTELVNQLFQTYDFDYIVNFAAESHVDRSIQSVHEFLKSNVEGTVNLITCAKQYWSLPGGGFKPGVKYLQISTDEVYGSLGNTGLFTENTPISPHNPYSASKAAADMFVKSFTDTYGFPANISRCSNNYGPFQHPEKLIPRMFGYAKNLQPLPLYGDGLNIRDWLYVEDHCSAIDLILHKANYGEIYNIGDNNERSNIEIVKLIINFVNSNVNPLASEDLIRYVQDRQGHDRRYGMDASKLKKDLDWQPKTSFDEGIIKTLEWYESNYDFIKNKI